MDDLISACRLLLQLRTLHDTLRKAQPTFKLPAIKGLSDDRRETPVVSPQERSTKTKLMNAALSRAGSSQRIREDTDTFQVNGHHLQIRSAKPGHTFDLSWANTPAAALHEDVHRMFNRIPQNHVRPRAMVARRLVDALKPDEKAALGRYAAWKGYEPNDHEEMLANLISYANNPEERQQFHKEIFGLEGPLSPNQPGEHLAHDQAMKRALHRLRQVSTTMR